MRNPFKRRREQATFDYSAILRSARTRRRGITRWQWAALGVLLFVVLAGAAAAWVYYDTLGDVQQDVPGVTPPEVVDDVVQPFNALLVGSDSRRGLTKKEQAELGADPVKGERADTLIVAHFDPVAGRTTMVQFPRDLYVSMPGGGRARINSALEEGHEHLVGAVEHVTGLEINRYALVNIAGFRDLVDAIGGVELCITEPIPFDANTGIEITEEDLGMVYFDGEKALRFVRSRKTLPGGDLDRIRNQQKFLAAALDKVTSTGTYMNPNRIRRIKNVVGDNIVLDGNTDFFDLRDLANRLRSPEPERYEAYTVPNRGPVTVQGASVVAADPPAMRVLFEALRNNRSPAEADGLPSIAPASVRVGVYNATGKDGAAARAARQLAAATATSGGPVKIVRVGNARAGARRTVVRHERDSRGAGELVAAAIPGSSLTQGKTRGKEDVAVIVGRRFRTRRLVQVLPIPLPAPSALPAECR